MKVLAFTQTNTLAKASVQSAGHQLMAKMQVVGAVAGLAGSVGSGLLGALLNAAGWLTADEGVHHWLSITGSALLFTTIPLLILGGYCMDRLEKEKSHRHSKAYRYDDDDEQ